MKIRKRFARATMTLALTVLTTATAWAQEGLTYNTAGDTCTIHNATGWNAFCILLENNAKGYFAGKTVVLGADITINRAAGQDKKDFTGTFDGGGHTITLAFGTDEEHPYKEHAAVFRNTEYGAKIQNLNVKGTIYTDSEVIYDAGLVAKAYGGLDITDCTSDVIIYTANKCAGGFVGYNGGTLKIANCRSNAIIHSTVNGDGTHGGFVGESAGKVNIEGCVFTGKMLTTNGTAYCGGFVGWSNSTTSITNSLYAPAAISNGETEVLVGTGNHTSCTFGRNNANVTLTNSYYTRTLGTAQGKQARTVKAGDNVTVALSGTATQYDVSGITAYANGLAYNQALYVSSGDKLSLMLSATPGYQIGSYIADGGTLTGNILTMPDADVTISATFSIDPAHFEQTGTNEYTIKTEAGWNVFCDLLAENAFGYFTGKTVRLGDDIGSAENPVTRMAGGSGHEFTGTFDGNGKTLTVHYTNTGNDVRTAPFSYISGATIMNLIVGGSITGTAYRAAGIVGEPGNSTIINCVSSVEISGRRYTGGFSIGGALTIRGCVFNGKINGTDRSGGFVGYGDESLVIDDCLFAPQDGSSINGSTFVYGSIKQLTNSYYTCALGTAQGKQAHTITAGDNVTINLCGTATEYDVSGITAYSEGILYNNAFYAGSGDEVSLSLGNTAPSALHTFTGYTASAGTLTGNKYPYTLTMPDADVTIGAEYSLKPVTYIDADGKEQTLQPSDYTLLTGNERYLSEGWYVASGTLNYDHTLNLNAHANVKLILTYGCQMRIGTSKSRLESYGIKGSSSTFTIYGQARSGSLAIYTKDYTAIQVGAITINGGYITANAIGGSSNAICVKKGDITINGGNITANTGELSNAIYVEEGDITINGGNITANTEGPEVDVIYSKGTFNYYGGDLGIYSSGWYVIGIESEHYNFSWSDPDDVIVIATSGPVFSEDATATFNKLFTDGTHLYGGTLTGDEINNINGKTLRPCTSISYLDADGKEQTCTDFTLLTGDETDLTTAGWYVVADTINYTDGILLDGDTHIILCDGAVMNVSSGWSDGISGCSLFVYGQSGQSGELNVTSNRTAIYIFAGDITIAGGHVTVSGKTGLSADDNIYNMGGNVTIQNATVEATGGIQTYNGGDITFDNSNVTVKSTSDNGIHSVGGGNVIIRNGGKTTVESSMLGIYCEGNVTIEGGQVSVTGKNYGIVAWTNKATGGNITLGWTNASDYIYINKCIADGGTLSIADGKIFVDEEGTLHTAANVGNINGKTLRPCTSIPYLDENGETQYCTDFTLLTENYTDYSNGWYVAIDTLNYTRGILFNNDAHLILADGCQVNIGTSESRLDYGIFSYGNVALYGQSTGDDKGILNIYSWSSSIEAGESITINGGHIIADTDNENEAATLAHYVTINGGIVDAYSHASTALNSSNVTINGGIVNVDAYNNAIYAWSNFCYNGGILNVTSWQGNDIKTDNGNYNFSWSNPSDSIVFVHNGLYVEDGFTATFNKLFTDGTNYYIGTLTGDEIDVLAGKTLRPCTAVTLADTDNALWEKLSALNGATLDVTLAARTIDTEWNTLALPFDVSADTLAAVFGDGVKLYELTGSSLDENVLGLNFSSATSIEAGKPYFIAASSNVVNPVFKGVTIQAWEYIISKTSYVDFIPTLEVSDISGNSIYDVLVLGGNNTLYNPASLPAKMKAFRGYFRVHDYSPAAEAMQFRMTFNDATEDDVTGIVQIENSKLKGDHSDAIYNLMGVRVKSADKGLFIVKGKKIIVK